MALNCAPCEPAAAEPPGVAVSSSDFRPFISAGRDEKHEGCNPIPGMHFTPQHQQ